MIDSVQFSSVAQLCLTLCVPMNRSTPGLPVHHQLQESTQTHVHRVSDALQLSHPLSSPSPPALNLSQDQGLFKWVSSPHEVAKVLEFQLQHQSFQWIPRTDLLNLKFKGCPFSWDEFLCLLILLMFLCVYEIRWNSYLWQPLRSVLRWECHYTIGMCPTALIAGLNLMWKPVRSFPRLCWQRSPW